MNRKRERLEIIHDILHTIQEKRDNVRPTHILYKSNLSHQMLTEYLAELISKGLVVEKDDKRGKKHYGLTDRGHNYLKDYRIIKGFVDSYGLK